MTPYIQADSPLDLRAKLDSDLRLITAENKISDTQWNERVQLRAFLKAFADRDIFGYPLNVFHSSTLNPDFRLEFLGAVVGIEASRITNEALHRLESMNQAERGGSISHVLVDSAPMSNDELRERSHSGTRPGDSWNSSLSEDDFWLDRACFIINRKTVIRRKPDYQGGGENWLLLWDRLTLSEAESCTRARALEAKLASYWNEPMVYDKIVLECEELKRFAVISRDGIC